MKNTIQLLLNNGLESFRQLRRFISIRKKSTSILDICKKNYKYRMLNFWNKYANTLEGYLENNNIPLGFLDIPMIRNTMFVDANGTWQDMQMKLLRKMVKEQRLKEYLIEPIVGLPTIKDSMFLTSHNSIHHLYHLLFFSKKSKFSFTKKLEVFEFGGGYGNMAKIIRRISPRSTYSGIDIPQFTTLQYIYLSSIFNESDVNLVDRSQIILRGKINLLTYKENQLNLFNKRKIDLFIATWSLSEAPIRVQNYFKKNNFFNARYLLFAYQKNNKKAINAENIKLIPESYSIIYNAETDYVKGNFYLFARKNI